MSGVVYFIQEGKTGPIKIGWTTNCPQRRRDNLQIGNSEDLYLIGIIPDAERKIEGEWHKRFSAYRKRTEWFWPASELLAAVELQFPAPGRQKKPKLVYTNDGPNCIEPLKEWMRENGVRQSAIAQAIGVSPSVVSSFMSGRRRVSLSMAKALEELTGSEVRASTLLGLEAA